MSADDERARRRPAGRAGPGCGTRRRTRRARPSSPPNTLPMTTTRTQPSMREARNAPDTIIPARASVAAGRAHVAVGARGAGAAPRPRMGSAGLAQATRRDVGVDLGRGQVLVAEQLLDDAQVRPAVEQVRRERVAQGVRRDAGRQAGRPDQAVEPVAQAAHADRARRRWLRNTARRQRVGRVPRRRARTTWRPSSSHVRQRGDGRPARAGRCAPCGPCPGPGSRRAAGRGRRGRRRPAR